MAYLLDNDVFFAAMYAKHALHAAAARGLTEPSQKAGPSPRKRTWPPFAS